MAVCATRFITFEAPVETNKIKYSRLDCIGRARAYKVVSREDAVAITKPNRPSPPIADNDDERMVFLSVLHE